MAKSELVKDLESAVSDYLKKQITDAVNEEFDKAVETVRQRQAEIVSSLALRMMKRYRIEQRGEEIVIIVKEIK